ncbi:MAG: hypothetical protein IRY99_04605 [Isosphaeraceae bacterium]|nr:hypothetical protein [Isosphaeraceae bacterium]
MRCLLMTFAVVLALGPALRAGDDPPVAKRAEQSPRERFEALSQEYNKAQQEFLQAYQKLKTDEEREQLLEEKYPQPERYAPQFLELAEQNPKDPVAVDALSWIVQHARKGTKVDRAIELLARDYAEDRKLGSIVTILVYSSSPRAPELLRAVLDKNPSREARGQACFALAQLLVNQAGLVRQLATSPSLAKRLEPFYGKEGLDRLKKSNPDQLEKEAEGLFERIKQEFGDLKQEFGDLKHYRGPLAKAAEGELFELHHLAVGKEAPRSRAKTSTASR